MGSSIAIRAGVGEGFADFVLIGLELEATRSIDQSRVLSLMKFIMKNQTKKNKTETHERLL